MVSVRLFSLLEGLNPSSVYFSTSKNSLLLDSLATLLLLPCNSFSLPVMLPFNRKADFFLRWKEQENSVALSISASSGLDDSSNSSSRYP